MTALKASQIHNERLTDRHSNPDIDRSDQNVVFFKTGNLLENVRERVADIQAGQKRKIRRDAPVAIEYMITASPEAMARLSKQEQEQYFAESLNFVEARHGTRNRLSAVLHLDETTPHLHVLVFPEREGKLDAKSFFKLPALTAMQDEFAVKVGRQFGLERGVRLTEQALSRLEQTTEDLAAIEAIQPQKNLFSSRVSVTQDEFETLSSQAKAYAATKEILQKRSKTLLERERSVESRETLTDKNECLTRQNKALAEENSRLRGALSTERSKNSILLTRIAELARLEQAEKELRELKAKLKDFEFYKNVHDFLKSSLQDFNKFLVPMNQWLQKKRANERKQNNLER